MKLFAIIYTFAAVLLPRSTGAEDILDTLISAHKNNYQKFDSFELEISAKSVELDQQKTKHERTFFAKNIVDGERLMWEFYDSTKEKVTEKLFFDGENWHLYNKDKRLLEIVDKDGIRTRVLSDVRQVGAVDGVGAVYSFSSRFDNSTANAIAENPGTYKVISSKSYDSENTHSVELIADSKFGNLPVSILTRWNDSLLQLVKIEYARIGEGFFPKTVELLAYHPDAKNPDEDWHQKVTYTVQFKELNDESLDSFSIEKLGVHKGDRVNDIVSQKNYRYGISDGRWVYWSVTGAVSLVLASLGFYARTFFKRREN